MWSESSTSPNHLAITSEKDLPLCSQTITCIGTSPKQPQTPPSSETLEFITGGKLSRARNLIGTHHQINNLFGRKIGTSYTNPQLYHKLERLLKIIKWRRKGHPFQIHHNWNQQELAATYSLNRHVSTTLGQLPSFHTADNDRIIDNIQTKTWNQNEHHRQHSLSNSTDCTTCVNPTITECASQWISQSHCGHCCTTARTEEVFQSWPNAVCATKLNFWTRRPEEGPSPSSLLEITSRTKTYKSPHISTVACSVRKSTTPITAAFNTHSPLSVNLPYIRIMNKGASVKTDFSPRRTGWTPTYSRCWKAEAGEKHRIGIYPDTNCLPSWQTKMAEHIMKTTFKIREWRKCFTMSTATRKHCIS